MNDPIADLLTRIRNAIMRGKVTVSIPKSTIKEDIVKVLYDRGFIKSYEIVDNDIVVTLKYKKGENRISGIVRVSKPSLRIYSSYRRIPKVLNGLGFYIISTPQGVISDKDAIEKKLGGELICKVW
jgi:small subunit ribosomal protein S8